MYMCSAGSLPRLVSSMTLKHMATLKQLSLIAVTVGHWAVRTTCLSHVHVLSWKPTTACQLHDTETHGNTETAESHCSNSGPLGSAHHMPQSCTCAQLEAYHCLSAP